MNNKSPKETVKIMEIVKQSLQKLRKDKVPCWVLIVPFFIPPFPNPIWMMMLIYLAIYFVWKSKEN